MNERHASRDLVLHGPYGRLPLRIYQPDQPNGIGLVWVHGGGFAYGDLDMPEAHHTSCWLAEAGITVASVDYHLAPGWSEKPEPRTRRSAHFPVASLEVAAAFHAVHELISSVDPGRWAIGGASAGGNLAVSAALRLRDVGDRLPSGLVLAYPLLHAELPEASPELRAVTSSMWETRPTPAERVQAIHRNYLGPHTVSTAPYAFPGGADLSGLPPVLLINSDIDPLRASGELFAVELADASVEVQAVRETGTFHGHLNDPADRGAARTLTRMLAWLTAPLTAHVGAERDTGRVR